MRERAETVVAGLANVVFGGLIELASYAIPSTGWPGLGRAVLFGLGAGPVIKGVAQLYHRLQTNPLKRARTQRRWTQTTLWFWILLWVGCTPLMVLGALTGPERGATAGIVFGVFEIVLASLAYKAWTVRRDLRRRPLPRGSDQLTRDNPHASHGF